MWKILAPVDLAGNAEHVVENAVNLATTTGSELVLLSVIDDARFRRGRRLAWPSSAFGTTCDIHRVVIPGRPAEAIVRYANFVHADVLFMSRQNHSAWWSLLSPSITARVARGTCCPMWIMDGRKSRALVPSQQPVIVCPLSMDETDDAIVRGADALAQKMDGQLVFLHVLSDRLNDKHSNAAATAPVAPSEAIERLRNCAKDVAAPWRTSVMAGPAVDCITEAAQDCGAALIVAPRRVPTDASSGRPDMLPLAGRLPCPLYSVPICA